MSSMFSNSNSKNAQIQTRLTVSVLQRSLSSGVTSILATAGYVWILSEKQALSTITLSFALLSMFANIPRLFIKVRATDQQSPGDINKKKVKFAVLTYLTTAAWTLTLVSQCRTFGIEHITSTIGLLITCGHMAATTAMFSPVRMIAMTNISILGFGATATIGMLATDQSGIILAGLAVLFTVIILTYTNQYYQTLFQAERQIFSQNHENESIKALLNSIPGFMTLLDTDLNFVMVNEAFEKKLNTEVIGKKFGFTGSDPNFKELLEEFMSSPHEKLLTEVRLGPVFNNEHYLVSMAKIDSPESRIAILTMNIEAQKKIQEQLMESRRAAEHAGRLAALGEMMSSVAHEIRNPLTIITGRACGLKHKAERESLSSAFVIQEVSKVVQMVDRISKIIQTVLRFSRGEADAKMVRCSVKTLLDEALFLTSSRLKNEGFDVRIMYPDPDLSIDCFQVQMGQVFVNLINNSIDALDGQDSKWISISAKSAGDSVQFTVVDSGLGIPVDIQSKLMQPFFTTKDSEKGTGLGLSISNGIIQKHCGTLTIDSSAKHTTFVITVPVVSKVTRSDPAA